MHTPDDLSSSKVKILLIDDDESEYHLVKEFLREKASAFDVRWVESLELALKYLSRNKVDVILLDLFLGDTQGLETFEKLKSYLEDIPVVILSGLNDERSAVEAVRQGAQDFLVKGMVDGGRLSRAIQFAVNRHETQKDPKNLGLIDPLTGFFNKKGFLVLADRHLKRTQRSQNGFFVFFTILKDLDKIKEIHGEAEGDHAVLTTAGILRENLRTLDIMARVGPDQFVVLTEQGLFSPNVLATRIKKSQLYYNSQFNLYQLVLIVGAAPFDAKKLTVKDLETKVDKILSDYRASQATQTEREFLVTP